jgi:hypothetical protein
VEIGAEDASEMKNDDHDNDRTDGDNQEQGAAILHSTPLGDVSASGGDHSCTYGHDGVGNDEQRTQRRNKQIRRGLLQHRSCERAATCARQKLGSKVPKRCIRLKQGNRVAWLPSATEAKVMSSKAVGWSPTPAEGEIGSAGSRLHACARAWAH